MKEEFNKDMENLRKNQTETLEIKRSLNQIKMQLKAIPADQNKWKSESQSSKIK
jgi:hypothetical protein